MTKPYAIRPLTPDLWRQLEELFGPTGASDGCWCMYWRIGTAYSKRPREKNKVAFKAIVKRGPPPGVLAFEGDTVVGWAQVTPRASVPGLDHSRFAAPMDDAPGWSLSCFFIRKGYRRRGVSKALIDAAVDFAKKAKARALEAYPVKTTGMKKSTSGIYTGLASSLEKAGFKTIAARAAQRPIMRLDLKKKSAA